MHEMDGTDLFEACLDHATAVVKQVRSTHFANSTPDAEWNVRDLLGHMLHQLQSMPAILEGETEPEAELTYNDELAGDDSVELSANWQAAVDAAELALDDVDAEETAHLRSGDATIDEYLTKLATDLLIHAWDLGKAIGVPVKFETQLAEIIYDMTSEQRLGMDDHLDVFAHEIEVIGAVDIQTRLLALFGRRADWNAA